VQSIVDAYERSGAAPPPESTDDNPDPGEN